MMTEGLFMAEFSLRLWLEPVRAWWNRYRTELKRRQAQDENPARFALSLAEGSALAGGIFAGAHGVGLAVSLSIMSSTYASLATVDMEHICVASRFVSSVVQEGRIAALQFFFGGVLAAVAASLPRAVWVLRNLHLRDRLEQNAASLPFEQWAAGYTEWNVTKKAVLFQVVPLSISCVLLLNGLVHALGLHASPESIQTLWQGFQATCGH
jgi:hypothetical protein